MAKVMIMAGGTGGHVFPGIAIAEALQQKGIEVCWLGAQVGMEKPWVEKAGIPFFEISIAGLRGNGLKGWIASPLRVWQAMRQAKAIMQAEQPDLVLGMGGFVCGPGGLATKLLGKPLVLHEQNAIPGLTNRLLSKIADRILLAFPQNKIHSSKARIIGNPVRASLSQVETVQKHEPCHLLVLGGSRGALALNETVPKALAKLPEDKRPIVCHQSGEKTYQQALNSYQSVQVKAEVVPFIDNMEEAYEWADLVICRAGALTVSELMATARPAILVPFPYAVDDHQTANAEVLAKQGGGDVIQQSSLTADVLRDRLIEWCESDKLQQASEALYQKRVEVLSATTKIVEEIISLLPRS